MRIAGVREFRESAARYLRSGEVVFITRHGKPCSMLVPLENPDEIPLELRRELVERLGASIEADLARKGVTEKEVLRGFEAWRKKRRSRRRRR